MKYEIIFSAPAPEDEAMLARALEMSMEPTDSKSNKTTGGSSEPNLAAMTEEEQIEYAMRMSMQVEYLNLNFYFICNWKTKTNTTYLVAHQLFAIFLL